MKNRPRRVGLGMKPREGTSIDSGQNDSATAVEESQEVDETAETSVDTGQEEVSEEGVEGVESAEKSEGGLNLTSLQNLDSEQGETAAGVEEEVIVAQLPVLEPPPAVPAGIIDDLNKMLEESKRVAAAEEQQPYIPSPAEESGTVIGAIQEAYESVKFTERPGAYAIGVDYAVADDKGAVAIVRIGENGAPDELLKTLDLKSLGLLPNGDTRTTVLVREGYWEGVESAAEADNMTIEEWLTAELASRLEDRFYGRH